jgi:hypothetical protein
MANQITTFLDPTQMPNQSQDQTTFDNLWAAVLAALPTFGAQFNASIANYNAANAGSAYAIPYTVDLSSTTDADPGNGKLRFGSSTQNASTVLRLDLLNALSTDVTAILDTFDASTSTVKGMIRLVKQGDATQFLMFNVTARSAPTGYRDITVTPVASSSANPFAQGDAVLLHFTRTGDKGDIGASSYDAPMIHVREELTSGSAPSVAAGAARAFNTVKTNTITGASLASSNITLPAGTYTFEALAPFYSNGTTHRISLYNNTASAVITYGSSESCTNTSSADVTRATVRGRFTIAVQSSLSITHANTSGNACPGGVAMNSGTEIYAEAIFRKVI